MKPLEIISHNPNIDKFKQPATVNFDRKKKLFNCKCSKKMLYIYIYIYIYICFVNINYRETVSRINGNYH